MCDKAASRTLAGCATSVPCRLHHVARLLLETVWFLGCGWWCVRASRSTDFSSSVASTAFLTSRVVGLLVAASKLRLGALHQRSATEKRRQQKPPVSIDVRLCTTAAGKTRTCMCAFLDARQTLFSCVATLRVRRSPPQKSHRTFFATSPPSAHLVMLFKNSSRPLGPSRIAANLSTLRLKRARVAWLTQCTGALPSCSVYRSASSFGSYHISPSTDTQTRVSVHCGHIFLLTLTHSLA